MLKLPCLVCYNVVFAICMYGIVVLRGSMHQYCVDSHYVIILSKVHTLTPHAYLQVV